MLLKLFHDCIYSYILLSPLNGAEQTVYHTIIEMFPFSVGNAENVSTFICLILICCQVSFRLLKLQLIEKRLEN